MMKGRNSTSKIKCSRKTQNNSIDNRERKLQQSTATYIRKKLSFIEGHYGEKTCNTMKRQTG
jgi:hypothetical protein